MNKQSSSFQHVRALAVFRPYMHCAQPSTDRWRVSIFSACARGMRHRCRRPSQQRSRRSQRDGWNEFTTPPVFGCSARSAPSRRVRADSYPHARGRRALEPRSTAQARSASAAPCARGSTPASGMLVPWRALLKPVRHMEWKLRVVLLEYILVVSTTVHPYG